MSGIERLVAHIESLPARVQGDGGAASSSVAAPSLNEDSVRAQLDKLTRLYREAFGNESEYVARLSGIHLRVETVLQKIATTATADAAPLTPKRSKNSTTRLKDSTPEKSEETAGMPFFYAVSRKFWRPNSELSDLWFFKLPHKVCNSSV